MSDMKRPLNAFTIDLEEWFQGLTSTNSLVEQWPTFSSRVEPATQYLLDILRSYRVQATFFCLGYVVDRHPNLIESICADGHEIGVHGYYHRFVSRISPDEFRREVELSVAAVWRITGEMPLGHRAPYFSVTAGTPWAFDILESIGIRYDSSVFPTRNMLYGYPGAPRVPYPIPGRHLVEFPPSTVRVSGVNWPIGGGFYLRAWPYAFIRWGIARLNRQGHPAILYLHPWELDLTQPPYPMTPRERFTHCAGRKSLAQKLHRLFSEFRFNPLRTLWEQNSYVSSMNE